MFFFFFQAEDGIRDLYVTGVQTCALPIWPARRPPRGPDGEKLQVGLRIGDRSTADGDTSHGRNRICADAGGQSADALRSEERRVGKECRSRGAQYQLKERRERIKDISDWL